MISDAISKKINEYVDEYIEETRLEFFYFQRHREIKEIELGSYLVTDSDLIVDLNDSQLAFLIHPIEALFIPEYASNFVVEYSVSLSLPDLVLNDFEVIGIASEELVSLSDSRVDASQLMQLIKFTCFDLEYQSANPVVRDYLQEIYSKKHPADKQMVLDRLRPMLMP